MNWILKSKIAGWCAMGLMIVVTVLCVTLPGVKQYWWELTDVFFAFMMVFCHLAALYLEKLSVRASKRLDTIAMVFGILAIVALICIYLIDGVG